MTEKIKSSEIENLKIASLSKRPTAKVAYGGEGYSSDDMKAAFDKLPLFLVERLNSLIDDIQSEDEGKISESIKTGIYELHTLDDFFQDVQNGNLASYLNVGNVSLAKAISDLQNSIDELKKILQK